MRNTMALQLFGLFFITGIVQESLADEITYAYVSDTNLIPTKQGLANAGELLGAGTGDIEMFGGSIYQIAVGDVTNSAVTIYQQDYYFVEGGVSNTAFSEQAVLVAVVGGVGSAAVSGLGYAIDAYDDVLMATAPTGNSLYGGVFVYHDNINDQWTQVQNLQPLKKRTMNGNFGYDVALNNNGSLAIVGEPDNGYITTAAGAAYIFGTANGDKKTYWTQLQELYPDNGPANSYFGAQVEMFGKYAAVTSPASCEIYLFEEETPKPKPCPSKPHSNTHSHRRRLHDDTIGIASGVKPRISGDRFLHWSLKQKLHAVDCSAGKDNMEIAFDEGRLVVTDKLFGTNTGKVFIYEIVYRNSASCEASMSRRLAVASNDDDACKPPPPDCTTEQFSLRTSITGTASQYLGSAVDLHGDIMVVSSEDGDGLGTVYVYQRIDAVTWNLVQTIPNPDSGSVSKFGVYSVGISGSNEIMATSLTGGGATGTANLYTYDLDPTWYCIVIAMYDLFGDGWSGARLKITSSTGNTEYFFPRNAYRRGQSENPTYVRYCPDDWDMFNTNTYLDIEIPHALDYPYHWEMRWKVYFESTKQWLLVGDHATKARLQFSRTAQNIKLLSVQHPFNYTSKCVDTCETFFSTKAPTKAPTKSKPSPAKTSPSKEKRVNSVMMNVKERAVNTFSRSSLSEEEGEEEQWTQSAAELRDISQQDWLPAASSDPIPSVASIPAPAPRRSLHLRTSSPSMSPAPTFAQATDTYAYPWITLQDPLATTWFQGLDTGTQWFLSSGDGLKLLGSGTKCDSSLENVCKLPLPDGHYPSAEDYVLRVTGDQDSRSNNFNYFFCGKTGAAPSHMDFTIDIYTEFLDGRCIGNNYFTLSNYMSATLDVDVILKGVLSLSGGYTALTELTDADHSILADMLRKTIHGDANVEVKFYTYNYYAVKKLGFDMYIPTSLYNLDPRVHGNVNQTFFTAMKYLKAASSRHSMGEELFNSAANSFTQSGLMNSFSSLLTVEVSEIVFGSFISQQHDFTKEWGSFEDLDINSGISSGHASSGSGSGSEGYGDDDGSNPVSFVTNGDEDTPTLSKTLLTYANMKMSAGAFFALSVMVYFVSRVRARRATSEVNSSLLDVSSSRLLVKKDKSRKKKKQQGSNETDELLEDDIDLSIRSSTDLEEGEDFADARITTRKREDHKNKSRSKKAKEKSRDSNKKTRKLSQHY